MEEEIQESNAVDYAANVDSSRPFRSVKEAVAIFGERFLAGEIYSPLMTPLNKPREIYSPSQTPLNKPPEIHPPSLTPLKQESPSLTPLNKPTAPLKQEAPFVSDDVTVTCAGESSVTASSLDNDDERVGDVLRRIEVELEETKAELRRLRERESETEIAVASLNAELHKNMSRLAKHEAAQAKAATFSSSNNNNNNNNNYHFSKSPPQQLPHAATASNNNNNYHFLRSPPQLLLPAEAADKKPSLADILELRDEEKKKNKKALKKKPIIPLVADLFARNKKGSSSPISVDNPLYSSSYSHAWLNNNNNNN